MLYSLSISDWKRICSKKKGNEKSSVRSVWEPGWYVGIGGIENQMAKDKLMFRKWVIPRMNTAELDKKRRMTKTVQGQMGIVTHQRREKGMCHGEFLYLVSEGKSPMCPSWKEAVLHSQLAEVGHDHPWWAWALWDENNWGTSLNIQQHPGCPLRMLPYLHGEAGEREQRRSVRGKEWRKALFVF